MPLVPPEVDGESAKVFGDYATEFPYRFSTYGAPQPVLLALIDWLRRLHHTTVVENSLESLCRFETPILDARVGKCVSASLLSKGGNHSLLDEDTPKLPARVV